MELSDLLTEIPQFKTYLSWSLGSTFGIATKIANKKNGYTPTSSVESLFGTGFAGVTVAGFSVSASQDFSPETYIINTCVPIFLYLANYYVTHLSINRKEIMGNIKDSIKKIKNISFRHIY